MSQYRRYSPWGKEGSVYLQVEGVCGIPFPKKERERERKEEIEKSKDISKMKDDVINSVETQESSKECRKIIMREASQDIKLPNLSRIFFNFVKFYYQYSFINCFHNIKILSFLFISRKLIASLKKVNRKQFEFQILILWSQSRLEVILQVEKKEYFCNNVHHFQILWINNKILNILTIFSSYPDMKWETWCPFWIHPDTIFNPSLGLDYGSFQDSFPSCIIWAPGLSDSHTSLCPHCPTIDSFNFGSRSNHQSFSRKRQFQKLFSLSNEVPKINPFSSFRDPIFSFCKTRVGFIVQNLKVPSQSLLSRISFIFRPIRSRVQTWASFWWGISFFCPIRLRVQTWASFDEVFYFRLIRLRVQTWASFDEVFHFLPDQVKGTNLSLIWWGISFSARSG